MKYRLYTYDLWGNEEDGYEVNDVFRQNTVFELAQVHMVISDEKFIRYLRRKGLAVKKYARNKDFTTNMSSEDIIYVDYKGYPLFELRMEAGNV